MNTCPTTSLNLPLPWYVKRLLLPGLPLLLFLLSGCTERLLQDIEWESNVWRELDCSSLTTHHGYDVGACTIGFTSYRDYRFASCLRGNGKVRTLRVLVPERAGWGACPIITEVDAPVNGGLPVKLRINEPHHYANAKWWAGYFDIQNVASTPPKLAIHLPRRGSATLFTIANDENGQPYIAKAGAKNELKYVVRSAELITLRYAQIPLAVMADATVILLVAGGGGMR